MSPNETPEYRGLLADVLGHPHEDWPRLVMADWLDDHGHHDRANQVRDRHVRVMFMTEAIEETWQTPLPGFAYTGIRARVRMGFVEFIRGSILDIALLGPSIVRWQPLRGIDLFQGRLRQRGNFFYWSATEGVAPTSFHHLAYSQWLDDLPDGCSTPYATQDDALEDLGQAALRWCRKEGGLS